MQTTSRPPDQLTQRDRLNLLNKFHVSHWAAWGLSGVLIVLFNRYTNLDVTVSNWVFDPASGSFPLKQNRLLGLVFHDGLRWLSAALWLGLLLHPLLQEREQRQWGKVFYVLGVSLLAAAVVSLLKSSSAHSCPWDLALYGGTADYFRLFEMANINHTGPGKCFPSGHASTAFMWIVLLYSTLPWLAKNRIRVACLILFSGTLAAGIQIAKGAHFPSHVLATAWLCWGVTLAAELVRLRVSRTTPSTHLG